jgi:DNA polymerase-3 subunit delta'
MRVSDIEEPVVAAAARTPFESSRRVFVLERADTMNDEVANRLLKTLEEPTPYVLFVLTASERGGVLPTIASRCQELRLRPAPRAQLASALEEMGVEPARSAQLAALAGGRQGWALSAAREPALFEQQQAYSQQLVAALSGSRVDRLLRARALAERWYGHPDTVRETLRVWMSWWRDVVLVQLGLSNRLVHLDEAEQASLRSAAKHVSHSAARAAAAAIQQTLADLDTNVNARLALDLLLLRLPALRA